MFIRPTVNILKLQNSSSLAVPPQKQPCTHNKFPFNKPPNQPLQGSIADPSLPSQTNTKLHFFLMRSDNLLSFTSVSCITLLFTISDTSFSNYYLSLFGCEIQKMHRFILLQVLLQLSHTYWISNLKFYFLLHKPSCFSFPSFGLFLSIFCPHRSNQMRLRRN